MPRGMLNDEQKEEGEDNTDRAAHVAVRVFEGNASSTKINSIAKWVEREGAGRCATNMEKTHMQDCMLCYV